MGNATIVAGAFALIILIIIAYFLGGIILTTGEVVDAAKKEQVNLMEDKQRTLIAITDVTADLLNGKIYVVVENKGGTILSDYPYWDIYTRDVYNDFPVSYRYNASRDPLESEWSYLTISPDMINPGQLNPSETMNISLHVPSGAYAQKRVKVVVPNGVSAETNI